MSTRVASLARPAGALAVLVVLGLAVAGAAAFPGDYRIIEGTLVWPQDLAPNQAAAQVAVVQGDLGARYFAEITQTTEVAAPVRAGRRVVVLAREGQQPNQVVAVRIEPALTPGAARAPGESSGAAASPGAGEAPPARAPAAEPPAAAAPAEGQVSVEGAVVAMSGTTLILRRPDRQTVAVDVAALEPGVRALFQPGREVSVFGVVVNGVLLAARGVNVDYGSALPGSR